VNRDFFIELLREKILLLNAMLLWGDYPVIWWVDQGLL